MRTQHGAHAYAAAVGEYAQHAASITWIVRSAPGVTEYQALCALRAFPDPPEARDHVLHQTHRAAWAGCRFCEREAAERVRRYSAVSAVSTSGHAGHLPVDGERADEYPPPCPPAIGITPATPIVPSRPLTPASRSSVPHSPSDTKEIRSDTGHTLKRSPSWTIKVQTLKRRSSAEAPAGAFNVVGVRYAPVQKEKTLPQHPPKEVVMGLGTIGYLPQDMRALA